LEENPWDVFETIFTVGSIHEGTIIEVLDKGAVISLPYGVEGFATPKHLVKEDGSQAQVDEKLSFKVIVSSFLTAASLKMSKKALRQLLKRRHPQNVVVKKKRNLEW
jgi:ribosomal protein S1